MIRTQGSFSYKYNNSTLARTSWDVFYDASRHVKWFCDAQVEQYGKLRTSRRRLTYHLLVLFTLFTQPAVGSGYESDVLLHCDAMFST